MHNVYNAVIPCQLVGKCYIMKLCCIGFIHCGAVCWLCWLDCFSFVRFFSVVWNHYYGLILTFHKIILKASNFRFEEKCWVSLTTQKFIYCPSKSDICVGIFSYEISWNKLCICFCGVLFCIICKCLFTIERIGHSIWVQHVKTRTVVKNLNRPQNLKPSSFAISSGRSYSIGRRVHPTDNCILSQSNLHYVYPKFLQCPRIAVNGSCFRH